MNEAIPAGDDGGNRPIDGLPPADRDEVVARLTVMTADEASGRYLPRRARSPPGTFRSTRCSRRSSNSAVAIAMRSTPSAAAGLDRWRSCLSAPNFAPRSTIC